MRNTAYVVETGWLMDPDEKECEKYSYDKKDNERLDPEQIATVMKETIDITIEKEMQESTCLIRQHGDIVATEDNSNVAAIQTEGQAVASKDNSNAAAIRSNAIAIGHHNNAATIRSNAIAIGSRNNAVTTGDGKTALSFGNDSNAVSSSCRSKVSSFGEGSNAVTSGASAEAVVSGNGGCAVVSGDHGIAVAKHENACAIAWGPESAAGGVLGSHLILTEWKRRRTQYHYQSKEAWQFKGMIAVQVDGETIKEHTLYRLEEGKVVEVREIYENPNDL